MRFNFRKISAVLTSAVMLGSSLGIAAAANYPAPFVVGSSADVAIVYGTGTGVSVLDAVQAGNVQSNLQSKMGTGSGGVTTTCAGGDCYLFELASTKLNFGDTLRSIKDSDLDDSELPNVLAELDYKAGDGKVYGYSQKIRMAGSATAGTNFTVFHDSEFNDEKPSVGLKIKDGQIIMNYTISWKKNPETDVNSALRLKDLENSKITLLGDEYTILNAYNYSVNSGVKLELMGGAVVGSVNRDETVTHTLGGVTYTIRPSYISDTKTTLCVSIDGAAEECESELEKGETFELSNSVQVGIRAINYAAKSGTIDSIDFSLGAEKLTIQDGQTVEINDEDINGLTVNITQLAMSGAKEKLGDIWFMWEAQDDVFISGKEEYILPGLGGLKISSGGFYVPAEEEIKVKSGGAKKLELVIPLKSGVATIPILYGNETTFTHIGSDIDDLLMTGTGASMIDDTPSILFNYSTCGSTYAARNNTCEHKWFVATWNSTTDAISYFLSLSSITESDGINYTSVKDEVTGETICKDLKNDDTCTLGNLVLTIDDVEKKGKQINVTLNAGGSFNRIYSKEGMLFWLPVSNASANSSGAGAPAATRPSHIDLSSDNRGSFGASYPWALYAEEEDKNGNLAAGETIVFNLSHSGDKAQVKYVRGLWAGDTLYSTDPSHETDPDADSEEFIEYIKSDLGTKILHKRPSGSGTQYEADVTYHGGESYGIVYLADADADISQTGATTTTTTAQLGEVLVKDTEVSSVASKNLIIVGGSCINSAAAKVLGFTGASCGAAFTEKTGVGSGQFLIESVAGVYASGKIALVVAGYDVADTQNAAKYLTTQVVDTSADKKYKGTSATSAELVVEGTA